MENENTPAKVWTREDIKALLRRSPGAVERAMVALWEQQLESERANSTASTRNGRGFSKVTAQRGTYYANWVRSGRRLTGKHLVSAQKIAIYHAGQLAGLANAKSQKENA
jgi:hypothetical protein